MWDRCIDAQCHAHDEQPSVSRQGLSYSALLVALLGLIGTPLAMRYSPRAFVLQALACNCDRRRIGARPHFRLNGVEHAMLCTSVKLHDNAGKYTQADGAANWSQS